MKYIFNQQRITINLTPFDWGPADANIRQEWIDFNTITDVK